MLENVEQLQMSLKTLKTSCKDGTLTPLVKFQLMQLQFRLQFAFDSYIRRHSHKSKGPRPEKITNCSF